MQIIFITGHLTKDAVLKSTTTQGLKREFVSFSVACNEQRGDERSTTFYDVTMPKTGVLDFLKQGTKVNITVYRPSENSYIDFEITRQQIEVETISHKMLDNEIGYIEMDSFDEVTYGQYMAAFNELKSMGMKALIVDIRSNGGGLLSSVCNILDDMLPEGLITYTEDKNGKRDNYSSDANCVLDIPAVVLVNGNSASASEIFTGAMQDYGKAVIVGTQTFGKGIVQTIMGLSDGSAIKMTTSRYYTPKGVCIHGVGITPDIVVEDDSATEEDEQLDKAVEVLLEKIGGR